ncbi:hypothetical protein KA017_03560 [Candidatus Woesebacteria bacterium]|nr:hypothetical protein [Candidatus Woesebacteria bacterium]
MLFLKRGQNGQGIAEAVFIIFAIAFVIVMALMALSALGIDLGFFEDLAKTLGS